MKNHKNPANSADTESQARTARPSFWLRAIDHRKHELTREYRRTLGDTAREGISDEDYATTVTTLEKMARNLGWDESQRSRFGGPRGRGFGRGFRGGADHPAMMRGFGPRDHGDHDRRGHDAHDHDRQGHHDRHHRGHGRDHHHSESPES